MPTESQSISERRLCYEALVLQGIWLIIRFLICGSTFARHAAPVWRTDAIAYFDAYGVQGEDAKRVRREMSFPPLPGDQ